MNRDPLIFGRDEAPTLPRDCAGYMIVWSIESSGLASVLSAEGEKGQG
jgi:hypothetical protein